MPDQVATRCEVIDLKNGEIVDLASASTERIAELAVNMSEVRTQIAEVEQAVSSELVARCDREASWTLRVGDPTVCQYEIKTASPTAGTETYPPDRLQTALAELIARGVISTDAASKACKRQLALTVDVPWNADLATLAGNLSRAVGIQIDGVDVHVARSEPSVKAVAAGINALRKVPGTAATLDEVVETQDVGPRRAKVTRKDK